MSNPVIRVENLSKCYTIGTRREDGAQYDTFREALVRKIKQPFRRLPFSGTRPSTLDARLPSSDFWALNDVSFEIQRGEVVGIIGRNGAGKSTLLKILSRITEPTSGRVSVQGRLASLLEVGTGFHPELTGRENIFLNGVILGMTRAEVKKRFDEIVAFAETEKFLDTQVKHYSSGMYVRLAFAVAAHLDPEILVVDEVLAVGDVAFQKKCLGKMSEVSRTEGRTILFVSHNLNAVRLLCQRGALLENGSLVEVGTVNRVLDRYLQGMESETLLPVFESPPELHERCHVSSARVETLDCRALPVFALGEPWRVRLGLHVASSQNDLVVAIGLSAADGTAVQSVWAPPRRFAPGNYEIVFTQNRAMLAVGSYTVTAGLSEQERSLQQFVVARFEIHERDAIGYFPLPSGAGWILNSMQIDVHETSSKPQ
ncbi:hypothetical protein AYO41_04045 [Verrucomicrobia bacterium SCGC AG-212-E04]|nr:hypothetical protein AYO41_04045 [Verrucomicrobia bacterium SCGC AG-212-E04]